MDNPLLDRFRRLHRNATRAFGISGPWFDDPEEHVAAITAREDLARRYSWAVPSPEAIDLITAYSPLVEIGAGRGYWAGLLEAAGANVVAYDQHPPNLADNDYHPREGDRPGTHGDVFAEVQKGGPWSAAQHPDRTLFLCWPPMTDMASDSLAQWGGQLLIYIGEGDGGCTGDERFHAMLASDFTEIADLELPQWTGIHDHLRVYRRC